MTLVLTDEEVSTVLEALKNLSHFGGKLVQKEANEAIAIMSKAEKASGN